MFCESVDRIELSLAGVDRQDHAFIDARLCYAVQQTAERSVRVTLNARHISERRDDALRHRVGIDM